MKAGVTVVALLQLESSKPTDSQPTGSRRASKISTPVARAKIGPRMGAVSSKGVVSRTFQLASDTTVVVPPGVSMRAWSRNPGSPRMPHPPPAPWKCPRAANTFVPVVRWAVTSIAL